MDSKCIICNKELKSRFLTLTDGKCCKECWTSAGIEDVPYIHADSRIYSSYDLPQFSEFRIQQETLKDNFHPTKTIYYHTGGIEFDDKTMTFRLTQFGHSRKKFCIFRYDQINGCRIEEDISKHTSVDLGRAALGETLLGEKGWWRGALSNITTSASCNSLGVIIELQDCPMDSLYIPLIDSNTFGKNRKYAAANATAEAIQKNLYNSQKRVIRQQATEFEVRRAQQEREMELKRKEYDEEIARIEREKVEIDRQIDEYFKHKAEEKRQKDKELQNQKMIVSTAEEIRQYKQLFDDGIITEEEFQAKKKQLLRI